MADDASAGSIPIRQAGIDAQPALARAIRRLFHAWLLHAFWFAAMCIAAWLYLYGVGLKIALLFALVTVPPVLFHAARVHRICRAIDPRARTIGLVPMLVMTVLFTPFEAGLIVPAKNFCGRPGACRGAQIAGGESWRGNRPFRHMHPCSLLADSRDDRIAGRRFG